MSDIDTGVGSAVTSRPIVRFTTTAALFPNSTQVVGGSPDTGTFSSVAARADVWDESARPVTVAPGANATGSTFTTSNGGPA